MIWICTVTDLAVKHLKEDLSFKERVDQAMQDQPPYLRKVLEDHEVVFSGVHGMPPVCPTDHKIELVPDAIPPTHKTYHMSEGELSLLKTELQRLLELGHIHPSTSPFGAPIFFVKEKTGKIRMVTDYHALNKLTVKNSTVLPNILELLDRLKTAKIFTKIDLQSGYHLIRMSEADIPKTAIHTKYGHFEWTVMPFGLNNAPATFQQSMNLIFADFIDKFLVVYLDDILIYSDNHIDHKKHLKLVLQHMEEHKLHAQVHKCRFLQNKVDYLGYIVGNGQISHDPKRVEVISSWPLLKTVTELCSFLGIGNTLLRFIPMFADLAAPLMDLLKGSLVKQDKLNLTMEQV